MAYIEGIFKHTIFSSENGYYVGILKVLKSSDPTVCDESITFVGYFDRLILNEIYHLNGEFVFNQKFGHQFKVQDYNWVEPSNIDSIKNFLTSSFIKGCGQKSAEKLIKKYKEDTLDIIKKDIKYIIDAGISKSSATKIFNSLNEYFYYDEIILELTKLGFSTKETKKIITKYGMKSMDVVKNKLYSFKEFIPFSKLDQIFFKLYDETNDMRINALIIHAVDYICFETGNTFVYKDEIIDYIQRHDNVLIEDIDKFLSDLSMNGDIKQIDNKIYLYDIYDAESFISRRLVKMNKPIKKEINLDNIKEFKKIENELHITYDELQKEAIKKSLNNNVSIITGGPGTGKTTIIAGIISLYLKLYDITQSDIALLAPTGRAAKRLNEITGFKTSTIHRFLKWNKENDTFGVNEFNPSNEKILIVDEASMIDTMLMSSLLKGIKSHCKIIIIGDDNQLPSIRCGNILSDLIESDYFAYTKLVTIYRQSDASFVPILANNVKQKEIDDVFLKKEDYLFVNTDKQNIKKYLKQITLKYYDANIKEKDLQVLIPMYKGENGIDNANIILQEIYNPPTKIKNELHYGSIIYRTGDKVINLENDVDNNIYNGDIGYIKEVITKPNETCLLIDFDNNLVRLPKENLSQIKHAYAISIHKSQGSEFDYVIMLCSTEYYRMLYNKLIYTGITRAKKSLVIIGEANSFVLAINNDLQKRRTSLINFLDKEHLK